MNNKERLAIAQAFYKQFAAAVKTNEPENLRGTVDAELADLYEETGASRVNVKINGQDMGVTLTYSAPEEKIEDKRVIFEPAAFQAWAEKNAHEMFTLLMASNPDLLLEIALKNRNGEVPDGTRIEQRRTYAKAKTMLRGVTAAKVAEAYGSPKALSAALNDTLALPGGEDADW